MSPSPASGGTSGARRKIRRATPADLPAIAHIEASAFSSDRIAPRSFARLIRRDSAAVLVAENGSVIVGCAVVLFRSYSRRARLYSIAVAPDEKGQGTGSQLLSASEAAAVAQGCRAIGLEVREDNAAAISLYRRKNYELLGRTDAYYSDGIAALHFRKPLSARAAEAA